MKKRIIYSVLLILTVLTSSCESWLDVDPRTKVNSMICLDRGRF